MKSKFMKVMGVVLTLSVLASLLTVGTAAPASAAAGTMAFGVINTPSAVGNVLVAGVNIELIAATPDGQTIFAFDDGANMMYKSTDGGLTFGTPVAVGGAGTAVGLVLSPNFANDGALVLAEGDNTSTANEHVWLSTNGGTSYVDVANSDLATKLTAVTDDITSIDLGYGYADNKLTILIGCDNATAGGSNVLSFTYGGFSWTSIGAMANPVIAVKFSPSHLTDAEIMAVCTSGGNTVLSSKFGSLNFNNGAYPDLVVTAGAATAAVIATASDYVGNTGMMVLVGTTGATTDDVFRITGRSGVAGVSSGRSVTTTGADISSIAVAGTSAAPSVIVGLKGQATGQVYRSTTVTASTTTWATSTKAPTGAAAAATNTIAIFGGAKVLAVTNGAATVDCALSVSVDDGATFVQISLMDVGTIANMAIGAGDDLEVVDANTMFINMGNTTALYAARNIFRTTDGGATWQRVLTGATLDTITASPNYATDQMIVIEDGTNVIQKSVNGGATFAGVGVPAAAVSVGISDTGAIYVGAAGASLYKVGRWANATGLAGTVNSIAFDPTDATGATIAVGNTAGAVYLSTNDGASFTIVGTAPAAGAIEVAYGPDGSLYAADAAAGAFRWTGAAWLAIQAGANVGLEVTSDGTLYMADSAAGAGIQRSLIPTGATLAACQFQAMSGVNIASWTAAFVAADLSVVNAGTSNNVYVTETTTAVGTFGYLGRIYGFIDTFIVPVTASGPADGSLLTATGAAGSVSLTWAAIPGALATTTYAGTIDTKADFTGTTFALTVAAAPGTSAVNTAALATGTNYYWRIRATVPLNSRYSTTRSFTTALAASGAVATAQFPTMGATAISVTPTLTWGAVAGADHYEIVVAEDTGATDKFAIIDFSANTTVPAYQITEALRYDTTYWWRIRAVNASTTGAWTSAFFTTGSEPAPVEMDIVNSEDDTTTDQPQITITQTPAPVIELTIPETTTQPVIPAYLLWVVIAVGAILIVSVIVLIVRTRRIS